MRILWAAAIVGGLFLAAEARADTVYLKDGQAVWGSEITEQGDTVIVSRPAGPLRIPKSDVTRIERIQLSIPQFYSPSAGESGPPAGGAAAADRMPSSAGTPGAGQKDAAPGAPPGSPPPGQTGGLTPTALPPPPPRGAAPSK
ncbi:MAG: hypothetical protein NTW68_07275 [candidate division NC10 bacterium]|nr:hypothetical protein [candidate division NC10 bacterium]